MIWKVCIEEARIKAYNQWEIRNKYIVLISMYSFPSSLITLLLQSFSFFFFFFFFRLEKRMSSFFRSPFYDRYIHVSGLAFPRPPSFPSTNEFYLGTCNLERSRVDRFILERRSLEGGRKFLKEVSAIVRLPYRGRWFPVTGLRSIHDNVCASSDVRVTRGPERWGRSTYGLSLGNLTTYPATNCIQGY